LKILEVIRCADLVNDYRVRVLRSHDGALILLSWVYRVILRGRLSHLHLPLGLFHYLHVLLHRLPRVLLRFLLGLMNEFPDLFPGKVGPLRHTQQLQSESTDLVGFDLFGICGFRPLVYLVPKTLPRILPLREGALRWVE
jgi:hypothetical protein